MSTFIFVTGHEFGLAALRGIISAPEYGHSLTCIGIVGLDPALASRTVGFTEFDNALRTAVPFLEVASLKSAATYDLVARTIPDFLLVIGWSELAPARLLDLPRQKHAGSTRHSSSYGCIGMHPTLLPVGRGRAPIPWTIINGLDETGVSAFFLEDAADAGAVISQEIISVEQEETATSLFAKVRYRHECLGKRLGSLMAGGVVCGTPQDESRASTWRRRRPEDGLIDFHERSEVVCRHVRALTPPYPGAFVHCADDVRVIVDRAEPVALDYQAIPGTVLSLTSDGPLVATTDGAVRLVHMRPQTVHFVVGSRLGKV